nr:hypothetical protein [Cryobacterium sp. TMT1-19]
MNIRRNLQAASQSTYVRSFSEKGSSKSQPCHWDRKEAWVAPHTRGELSNNVSSRQAFIVGNEQRVANVALRQNAQAQNDYQVLNKYHRP